jgi:nucleotide-binding universal stress UspA family protein
MRGGKLVIVYACRPLHSLPPPLSTHERHNFGRALLDELMLDGDDELFDIDFAMEVSDKDPVTALIDTARHHEARAIVIGAKHHLRFYEALGSVTSELLKTPPVPAITVPPSASQVSGQTFTQSAAAR